MADIVVVGGGLAGISSALRLAKNGHSVRLVERGEELGGALRPFSADGFTWDAEATAVPGVLRDLFRKTGRPLEKELDLLHVEKLREHRFEDGSSVALPSGSRAEQKNALDQALGEGAGDAWVSYVHSFADDWDVLRRNVLEVPYVAGTKAVDKLLATRTSLLRRSSRALRDDRLVQIALHHALALGQHPRNTPGWFGIIDYLEQNFGTWAAPSGLGPVLDVLESRLATRGVSVMTGVDVRDVVVERGRARAVRAVGGWVDADVVVVAVDPRHLPATARMVERTAPALAPVTTFLGLGPGAPELSGEVVLHGDPTITVRSGGIAPPGGQAWTLTSRGRLAEDIVTALVRLGIDVREFVESRHDLSPAEQATRFGSSYGLLWQGPRTFRRALHTITPVRDLYLAGASATVSALPPFVALTAAQVAEAVGPADGRGA